MNDQINVFVLFQRSVYVYYVIYVIDLVYGYVVNDIFCQNYF